jgi:MOSC domain-containing protein YiiM
MRLVSVSVGSIQSIPYRGQQVKTGIFKTPVDVRVDVGFEGILLDVQVDRKNHGGADKALYAYSYENLCFWAADRGDAVYPPGHMGENLTIEDLDDHAIHLGDRFRIGTTLLEVTQPRVPCFKLGVRMGDGKFVGQFLKSGRTGFYLRVLEAGELGSGDRVERISIDPARVSIPDAMKAILPLPDQKKWISKVLEVSALSAAWREDLLDRLEGRKG